MTPLPKKVLLACLHGIFLFILTLFALNIDYTFQLEERFITATSSAWQVFHNSPDDSREFTFIDVSGSPRLLDRADGTGDDIITNREKLARLFDRIALLGGPQQPIVICDLLFEKRSPDDARLRQSMGHLQKLIIAFSKDEKGVLLPVFSDVPRAYVGYPVSSGFNSSSKLVKFDLRPETGVNSLPLEWAETQRDVRADKRFGLLFWNDGVYLNSIIPDIRIPATRIAGKDGTSKILSLEEALQLLSIPDSALYTSLFKARTFVIGDFHADNHDYYGGRIPGVVLLTNIFLGLQAGDNKITLLWVLFMIGCLSLLSWIFLYPPRWENPGLQKLQERMKWLQENILGQFVGDMLGFGLLLWLLSFLSFLFFHKHADVVFIDIYLSVTATIRFCIHASKKGTNTSKTPHK